jgi:alkyldihydroxyacetonephosphate synthase
VTAPVVERLREHVGDRVRTDEDTRSDHRHDTWVLAELLDMQGETGPLPLAVVYPESTEEVAEVVRICREARVPLVPFGGGSGVCGAIRAHSDTVVLSTRRLRGLRDLDSVAMLATFGAGTLGIDAEQEVEKEGLTIGHWPQSVDLSTVGGWIATRAAGQFSTLYGNIEDVVLALEVVLPDGRVLRTRRTPRSSAGPDLKQLFMGSEGLFGVVTEVTFSLRQLPESKRGQTFHFEDFSSGLDAIRRFMREGWRPPVVRLYDPFESGRQFAEWCPQDRATLLLVHEGPFLGVTAEAEGVADLCRVAGGVEASSAAVDHWLEHRNRVPSFREFLERGIIVDTVEVAATWDRVANLYDRVTRSLREVPGVLVAMAHSSHSYRSGTNLYITFAARPEDRGQMASTYRECWRRVMEGTLSVGAGIAHHHGVGRVRKAAIAGELGETGVSLLRMIKQALDPEELLNPGTLLPDSEEDGA